MQIFDAGTRFGEYARTLYPGGVLVQADWWNRESALEETLELLTSGSACVLFEPAFLWKNTFVRCDIFERNDATNWSLWEVKAVAAPSASHIFDLAVQSAVTMNHLEEIDPKYEIAVYGIIHLAGKTAVNALLSCAVKEFDINRSDFTEDTIRLLPEVEHMIDVANDVVADPNPPTIQVGKQCHKPYECPYLGTVCK